MNLSFAINILSVCLNMTGTLLMFWNTPKVNSGTYIYDHEELIEIHKQDERKNKFTRFGMLLLFGGFLLQLVALILDHKNQ